MADYIESLQGLAEQFGRLPGVGRKSAMRMAFAVLELTDEEIAYLEAPYVPHPLAGVMAQNKPANARERHVWTTGNQKI